MESTGPLKIGIVGTGMIANVMADVVNTATNSEIAAVSSRSEDKAKEFAKNHSIERSFGDWEDLVSWEGVDAVYIGVPTIAKEEIAIAAAKNGKHLLVDKPFLNYQSVKHITDTSRENNVAFMDATHFVHHPRTLHIQTNVVLQIGTPQAVHTTFFAPLSDMKNIRFDSELEPTGAIGDMAWYSARAIVEYLPNAKQIKDIKTFVQRDPKTNAILRGAGIIIFEDGSTSNWDIGYNAGVFIMDLDILGTEGSISLNDFVLDWSNSFPFNDPEYKVGYTLKRGLATPKEFKYVETPSEKAQAVLMIERFIKLIYDDENAIEDARNKAEDTQRIVDSIWNSLSTDQ